MFPLFWRIFLLIWLAMAITVLAGNLATHALMDQERESIERQIGLRNVGLEAMRILSDQGRRAAFGFLREQGDQMDLHMILVENRDSDGRLPPAIRDRIKSGWYRHKPAVINISEGYQLVAWPRKHGKGWLDPDVFQIIEVTLAFVMITLACWLIARVVSRPLKHMERTARIIAGGKTELRVNDRIANRRDEVGQLAMAFNAMTDQLCSLLERQKHLLRDISHDLRTPLARQRVAIELASEVGSDTELMASILRQNERLETMTSQILTLYRVADQGGDIEREPVKPVPLINQVLSDAADYAEHQGVDCHLTASNSVAGVTVLGDSGLLQRALDNIVQNALDHTPPGHSVHVGVERDQGGVRIEVRDEGAGADEEVLSQLFEPFFQADKSRGGAGWGLGLAIARDIISAHDGHVSAANDTRGGLRVTIWLPLFTVD